MQRSTTITDRLFKTLTGERPINVRADTGENPRMNVATTESSVNHPLHAVPSLEEPHRGPHRPQSTRMPIPS
jgi:hypothetical protein